MAWNLFIDDERNPADVTWAPWQIQDSYRTETWVIARNVVDVAAACADHKSMPNFVSFDHDLGDGQMTGFEIAKMLVSMDLDKYVNPYGVEYSLPTDFGFYVHSKNPIGKTNIESYLNNYLSFKQDTGV